jgi:hypothetical protein
MVATKRLGGAACDTVSTHLGGASCYSSEGLPLGVRESARPRKGVMAGSPQSLLFY